MDSVRSFVGLWVLFTAGIIGYAVVDLRTHPELQDETHFSMEPDLSKIGSLPHWGGRLLKEQAHGLLICNAIALAGLMSLSSGYVVSRMRRRRAATREAVGDRPSMPARFSVPPP